MGVEAGEDELNHLLSKADADGSGLIDFEEFLSLIADQLNQAKDTDCDGELELLSYEELHALAKSVFSEFDEDRNGSISSFELGQVFKKMGCHPTEDELKELVDLVDEDKSGVIEFEEFMTLMQKM